MKKFEETATSGRLPGVFCPECGAHRGHLLGCSRESPALRLEPARLPEVPVATAPEPSERRRLLAFPFAWGLAWALVSTDFGAFLGRTFAGMWLHELGHASAAWLSGHWALPLPWFTFHFGRSVLMSAAVFGLAFWLVVRGRRRAVPSLVWAGGALAVVALLAHALKPTAQEQFFTFAGEAGAMVFGAGLATTFVFPPTVKALKGGLRWGWLALGTVAWADATHLWWLSRRDPANLPFGLEGGTTSDATKLVDQFHWDEAAMIARYLWLAGVCLFGALLVWGRALSRTRSPGRP